MNNFIFDQNGFDLFALLLGNKLVSTQKSAEDEKMAMKATHEFDGDELRVTMEVAGSDTVCKKIYKRVNK